MWVEMIRDHSSVAACFPHELYLNNNHSRDLSCVVEPHSVVHSQVVREEAKNRQPIHTHLRTKMRLPHTLIVEVIACVEALEEGEYQPVKRFLGETLFGEIAAGNCSLTGLHTTIEQGTQKLRTEKTETCSSALSPQSLCLHPRGLSWE